MTLHSYDSTCPCDACRHTELALQERPARVRAAVADGALLRTLCSDALPADLAGTASLMAEAGRELAAWRALGEAAAGDTLAARAASEEDLRRLVQQQLQERAHLRALASLDMRPPACAAVDKALEVLTLLEVGVGTPNLGDIAELLRTMLRYRQALETLEERLHHGEDVADVFAVVLRGEAVQRG